MALMAAVLMLPVFAVTVSADDPVTEYDLWLGDTRVTSANQDDIFSDGKSKVTVK